jgi:hypothetical protein
MLIRLIGSNNEALEEIDTASVKHCVGVAIYDMPADDRREHFPIRPASKPWTPNRKIATLPTAPPEVR